MLPNVNPLFLLFSVNCSDANRRLSNFRIHFCTRHSRGLTSSFSCVSGFPKISLMRFRFSFQFFPNICSFFEFRLSNWHSTCKDPLFFLGQTSAAVQPHLLDSEKGELQHVVCSYRIRSLHPKITFSVAHLVAYVRPTAFPFFCLRSHRRSLAWSTVACSSVTLLDLRTAAFLFCFHLRHYHHRLRASFTSSSYSLHFLLNFLIFCSLSSSSHASPFSVCIVVFNAKFIPLLLLSQCFSPLSVLLCSPRLPFTPAFHLFQQPSWLSSKLRIPCL